ncbi:MAG TPA: energy-coupling factor ABC transporter permease [Candidatus Eisenbacteria bacterium]
MSHLHVPDGVLPPLLWGPGLALALVLLALAGRAGGRDAPKRIAYQGALGGLMLAVMSIPIPLFALEYCLTLAGPVGVLLGPAASFPVVFVVSVILALLGQGGLTVVGLNALVLGSGAAVARPVYVRLATRLGAPSALALATAAAQTVSGLLWFALLALALRLGPGVPLAIGHGDARVGLFAGLTIGLWIVAIAAESAVAFGIGRFLARVRPDLLPAAAAPAAAPAAAGVAP